MKKIIAFDLSSGDCGSNISLDAAIDFLSKNKDWKIKAFTFDNLDNKNLPSNIEIIKCDELIAQTDGPLEIRRKKNSTLIKSIEEVIFGNVDAIVSSAASGPLVTASYLMSKTIKNLKPAFAPIASSVDNEMRIFLDVGANIGANSIDLLNNAKMGIEFAKALAISENPIVKQLNVGTEDKKGTDLQRETFSLLSKNIPLNFKGNIEANKILTDKEVNVVLTEAYSGNIALKSYEGAISIFKQMMKDSMNDSSIDKLGFYLTKNFRKRMKGFSNDGNIGGAVVLGLNHLVIKAHGSSKQSELFNSLNLAKKMIENNLIENIKNKL